MNPANNKIKLLPVQDLEQIKVPLTSEEYETVSRSLKEIPKSPLMFLHTHHDSGIIKAGDLYIIRAIYRIFKTPQDYDHLSCSISGVINL